MIFLINLKDFLLHAKLPNAPSLLYKETEKEIILYLSEPNHTLKAVYEKPSPEETGVNIKVADFKEKYLKNALRIIEAVSDTEYRKKIKEEKEETEEMEMPKTLDYQSDAEVAKQSEAE